MLVALLGLGAGAAPFGQAPVPPPGQQVTPATGFIAGVVIDSGGRPIPEAMVSMSGAPAGGRGMAMPGVIADERGRFFFRNVAAGVYRLQASKAGYGAIRSGVQFVVEVADGERVVDGRIRLARVASIAGIVRDTAGDPVVGTEILLFRRTIVNGRQGLQSTIRGVKTDDRGRYRLPSLMAGEYLVCACLRDPNPLDPLLLTTLASEPLNLMSVAGRALKVGADVVSLDETLRTYAPTFHQDGRSAARAARVTLAAGEGKIGVDITAELVRAVRVTGRVVGAQSTVQASSIRLIPAADVEAGIELTQIAPMLVQDGRFDFAAVPPGQYVLTVSHFETGNKSGSPSGIALGFAGSRAAPPPGAPVAFAGPGVSSPPLMWARVPVAVGESSINNLVVSLGPAPSISGRLQFVGSSPQPTEQMLTRGGITLQPAAAPTAPYIPSMGPVAANASFRIASAMPAKYTFSAIPVPGYSTLKSVTVAGVDLTDLPIELGEKDVTDVVLTYIDTPLASLAVSVAAPPGQRPDDESVLIFPVDKKFWQEPFAARRRFRTLQLSTKGTASATDLPAGDYLVVLAIGDDAVDWQEPSRLDALSRRAQRVTIGDGGKQSIEVRR